MDRCDDEIAMQENRAFDLNVVTHAHQNQKRKLLCTNRSFEDKDLRHDGSWRDVCVCPLEQKSDDITRSSPYPHKIIDS